MTTTEVFADALLADRWSIPSEHRLFAPLIGSWDLTVRWYDASGQVARQEPGEWHFAVVLAGRAIQDVWIVPPRARSSAGEGYEYGSSLRFYDPEIDAWRSTWIGPVQRMTRTFIARRDGDDITMLTTSDVDPALRWTFHSIESDAFEWRNEVREADGWRVQQSFVAERMKGSDRSLPIT